MEISVKELDLASKTKPIPKDGVDPYRMVCVGPSTPYRHDELTSLIGASP